MATDRVCRRVLSAGWECGEATRTRPGDSVSARSTAASVFDQTSCGGPNAFDELGVEGR